MYVSIFTDELGLDVAEALPIIRSWGLDTVDFRAKVFGKGIEALSDSELGELRHLVDEHNLRVGCLQTSLGKVHLPDPERRKQEEAKLEGVIRAADALKCRLVRSFSYWQPAREEHRRLNTHPDALDEVLELFAPIAGRAEDAGLVLSFENCGVTPDEVFALLDALKVPGWDMAWDVANSWWSDERRRDEDAFIDRMARRANCVHVKARGALDWLPADLIPYAKVLQACQRLGLSGPVSAETHTGADILSKRKASEQLVEAIRHAWPAPAAM